MPTGASTCAPVSGETRSIIAFSQNLIDQDYLEEVIPAPEFGGPFNHNSPGRISGVDFTDKFRADGQGTAGHSGGRQDRESAQRVIYANLCAV